MMRVLSLFSGIGGFDLGLERAGMTVIGQVEIDPYCRKVLARHWPEVPRYEDVRDVGLREPLRTQRARQARGVSPAIEGRERPDGQGGFGTVDLVCGGFPCQDVSVAGRRAGLDGARSGLWFEFERILRELRPRWALIENVPGLLSSNQGRDFAYILDGLGECGFGSIAWAVLDSQHFGVAQRRRRVFIVCGPTGPSAEQVLALCESCGGHPAAGGAAREGATGETGGSVANPLGSNQTGGFRFDLDGDTYVPEIAWALQERDAKGPDSDTKEGHLIVTAVRTAQTSSNGWGVDESGTAYTLDGTQGQAVAQPLGGGSGARGWMNDLDHATYVPEQASVRRLTPTECMRLQGFPDWWFEGNDKSDGPMYRALGNAVTVPVLEWIGRRIMALEGGA